MFYRGYEGTHDFDPDEMMYIGSVKDIEHFVQYKGSTPEELEEDFKREIDKYINFLNQAKNF